MAFDAFLKIGDIKGESSDAKHKEEINVLSFSWAGSQPGVAAGQPLARNARVQVTDLSFVKRVDSASPALMKEAAMGGVFPEATLVARKAGEGQQDFLKVKLSDVMITSVSAAGNSQTDPVPLEQISLTFSKIELAVASDSDLIL